MHYDRLFEFSTGLYRGIKYTLNTVYRHYRGIPTLPRYYRIPTESTRSHSVYLPSTIGTQL